MSDCMYKKIFSKNLCHLLQAHGKNQSDLIKDLGFTKSAVSSWCRGTRIPRMDKVEELARYFGIQKSDLIEDQSERLVQKEVTALRIPILRRIPAGIPIEAIDDIKGWEEISASLSADGRQYFGMIVEGDSMAPKYLEGDRIIIEITADCESGNDCIVYIDDLDATLKRVIKNDSGVILQSLNPAYEPIVRRDVAIAGRVIEIRRSV